MTDTASRGSAGTGHPSLRRALLPGALLAYGSGLALHALHPSGPATGAPAPAGHGGHAGSAVAAGPHTWQDWLTESTWALPLAMIVVLVAGGLTGRLSRWAGLPAGGAVAGIAGASMAAGLFAAAALPASGALLPATQHLHGAGSGTCAAIVLLAGLAVLLTARLGTAAGAAWATRPAPVEPRSRARRRAVAVAVPSALSLPLALLPPALLGSTVAEAAAPATPATCTAGTADRTYDIAAINVTVAYNRWGQTNPNGQVYVLQGDKSAVKNWHQPLGADASQNRRLRPRPLVIRANEGECVRVNFSNELDERQGDGLPNNPRASMTVRGVPTDVQTSAGSHVGYNDDTTVSNDPGANSITYYWSAPTEGIYFFNDTATPAGHEGDGGSLAAGLYGAFVVEPPGSTWRDARSGKLLYSETGGQSGELYLDAMITPGSGRPFRESVQIAQDELPHTSTFAFNYGSEPQGQRDADKCADCVGEETSLSSWAYGDPAMVKLASGLGPWRPKTPAGAENCGLGTPGFDADSCFTSNVTHSYVGDPFKIRYGMAGVKETHIFHMHAHQWLAEDKDVGGSGPTPGDPGPGAKMPDSQTIDSQTFGPMEMFTADLLFGAGSKPGTVGDSIFHCHLYPHFADGFWALFRTHDVTEDGTGSTPDGVKVWALAKLPGGGDPPAPTADNPGFPRFIPGKVGWRAPQPPLGITQNGAPTPRVVAGKPLADTDPAVQLETAVRARLAGGADKSVPGAPFRDPCPVGARQVTYKVSAIQTKITYNERLDHDPQGRILVLDSEVDDVLAGRKNPEPLFSRVNAGDCVTWQLTNRLPNWFGNDAFVKLQQTNMFGQHIHLVKFDVLASDGSSNGWNYQQAAFSAAQAKFNADAAADPSKCTPTKCRLDLPATFDPRTTSQGLAPGQTITERWYADYELRTVFTHDHHFAAVDQNRGQFGALVVEPSGFDFRDPKTGAYKQPVNNAAHGPVCGTACEGKATGTALDAIGPGPNDDFRDFGLAVADFVPLVRGPNGNPQNPADVVNPPPAPEDFPDEDPGTMGVNYRNAPLELRKTKNGSPVDPAYVFSSHVFGDPRTPVLQTYQGDNVRIRLIQGSQEEQHQVQLHGLKWKREPDDPQSPVVGAMPVGVSEAFNLEMPRLSCNPGEDCRGDYLYSSSGIDDIDNGMWGLLRVNGGKVPGLLELPDNLQARAGSVPTKSTALAPPARTGPGSPCPTGAPVRKYSVVAMQAKITYNEKGEHDPYGMVYVPASQEAAVRAGANPTPLVLRATEGDCIEVTLTNKLTSAIRSHTGVPDGDAETPAEPAVNRPPGLRVSMHPGLLKFDVRGSDGAAVGFNRDSTVGNVAGSNSIVYRWFADDVTPGEIGAVNLTEYGDVRGHRHHGLFGGLVVEPRGASWYDPATGRPLESGAAADIRVPGRPDYREHIVFFQDGLNLRTATGAIIRDPEDHPPLPGEPAAALDAEDRGEKAFNYRNAPFRHRLGYEPVSNTAPAGPAMANVYDSHTHGDPMTPIFRAYTGDQFKVRVLQGSDKPRQHAFQLSGYSFKTQPDDPGSRVVGTLSGLTVNSAVNADMGAAGGAGDYLYGCAVGFFHRSGGLWGMTRVYPRPAAATDLQPTAVPGTDDPRAANNHPLLPLELDSVKVDVFNDLDRDGVHDANEPAVAGAAVAAKAGTTTVTSATSAADGFAYLSVRDGTYGVAVTPPAGYALHRAPASITVAGDNVTVSNKVALRKL
jgi:hypothetical protein